MTDNDDDSAQLRLMELEAHNAELHAALDSRTEWETNVERREQTRLARYDRELDLAERTARALERIADALTGSGHGSGRSGGGS